MLPVKLQRHLGADEIRAVMQDKPRRNRRWQKVLVNTICVIGMLLMLYLAAAALLGPAIDHELDRMPTAESVGVVPAPENTPVVSEDEPGIDPSLLAALIHAEARGEPFEGQVAVGAVVLNRVADPRWPDTVEGVVLQPGQFARPSGANPDALERYIRAAQEALNGTDPTNGAVFFYNPELCECGWIRSRETVANIGSHKFAR